VNYSPFMRNSSCVVVSVLSMPAETPLKNVSKIHKGL